MVSPVKDAAWLQWIERLLEVSAPPAPGTGLLRPIFHCRLDDQPDHLVPQRSLGAEFWENPVDHPLFMNPHARFTRAGELPDTRFGESGQFDNFALDGDLLWLQDPATHAWQPFWLAPGWRDSLARLSPGDCAPAAFHPLARRVLTMANVLVPENYDFECRQAWAKAIESLRPRFLKSGYVPVAQLIHPFHIAALRRYYRCLIRRGGLALGDQQSARRYVSHNESVARFFHHQLTSAVAAIVGQPLKPSYVYLASYQAGAQLEKHTDRPQCEFSITLCLDYSPEPRHQTAWPIHLHTSAGKTTVFQALGDSLLYRGRELPHSRDPLPAGTSSTSIFFHYVPTDFDGPLD